MQLPVIITKLLEAQNKFDSEGYASCFSDNAIVHDEGKTYKGRNEIKQWNEATNRKYHTRLEPVSTMNADGLTVLATNVSGTFDGSPLLLNYYFELKDNQVLSLRITDK